MTSPILQPQTNYLTANGISLCYARFQPVAKKSDVPLILIRGLGTQLIQWPPAFIEFFTQAGLEVIVFDNRDVGESQKFDAAGVPDIMALLAAGQSGISFPVPYQISDMAADIIGLMDALDIAKAHIFGMSLGGMVAQHLAFSHSTRMAHVVCVMSSSGNPDLPRPAVSELAPPDDAEDIAALTDYLSDSLALHASPDFPTPQETRIALAAQLARRNYHPQGIIRQMAAAIVDGNRVERLKTISVPFMVIHGLADTLIDPICGEDIAANVPSAIWRPVDGMNHDLGVGIENEIGPDILTFFGLKPG